MHVDPHAIAFTPDFEITLKPSSERHGPLQQEQRARRYMSPDDLWMANDGGVYLCDDGGQKESQLADAERHWRRWMPINIAGLFGHKAVSPRSISGCGDNNDFFTRDGGHALGRPAIELRRLRCVVYRYGARRAASCSSCRGASRTDSRPRDSSGSFAAAARSIQMQVTTAARNSLHRRRGQLPMVHWCWWHTRRPTSYLAGYRPLILNAWRQKLPLPDGDVVDRRTGSWISQPFCFARRKITVHHEAGRLARSKQGRTNRATAAD